MGERERYDPGTFSWAELSTSDVESAKGFYTGLFGWDTEDQPLPDGGAYTIARVGGRDVAGLTPAQPGGVEQHHPYVQRLRPEPRGRGGRPVVGGHQQSGDLVLRQDGGRCVLMRGREAGPIRDEARRLRPAAVKTELAHHTHLRALVPGFQVGLGPAPALEHLQRELGRVLGHQKRVEEGQHASLHRIAPS